MDSRDPSDAVIIRYEPFGAASRRLRFEPITDGWVAHTETWIGNRWHPVGTEAVERLVIEDGRRGDHD